MAVDDDRLLAAHKRLLDGDRTASADLVEYLYSPLIGHALKKHGRFGMDPDKASDLAVKLIGEIVDRPGMFDPSKGKLFGFLCMALDRDAINAGRDEKRRRKNFESYSVEVREVGGNSFETTPTIGMDARRIMEDHGSEILRDDGDREVLDLILEGERDYSIYAERLGIVHLDGRERDAEVKRRKDRIEKRLERIRRRL